MVSLCPLGQKQQNSVDKQSLNSLTSQRECFPKLILCIHKENKAKHLDRTGSYSKGGKRINNIKRREKA